MKKNNNVSDIINFSLKLLKLLYYLLVILLLCLLIKIYKEFKIGKLLLTILKLLSPFIIGFVLSYLLNPIINKMGKKMNRSLAVSIIFISLILFFVISFIFICPEIKKELFEFVSSIPEIIDNINIIINNIIKKFCIPLDKNYTINIKSTLIKYIDDFNIKNLNIVFCFIKNIFSILGIIVLSLTISFYLLLDFDKTIMYIKSIIKNKRIIMLLKEIDEKVFSFIKGTILIAVIVFILSYICFLIFGLKASIFFALYNALTNIIPYVGPYIGGIPIVIIAFTSSKKIGIGISISVIIIQILESYVLQPIIMSKKMHLHPVTILIGLLLFGYFFGIIGMVIAMPIISIIKTIIIFIFKETFNE